jgi:DNA-binding IclR family transcriptional regulator
MRRVFKGWVKNSTSEDDGAIRGPRGIQSVEVGGRLLLALANVGRALSLKDLAQEAEMAPGKAHPYLVIFGKLGLIEQDAAGRYGLGPLALQLGLISLQQYDPVRLATPVLADLAQATGHTAAIALWGNRGPTIVRIEEAPSAVHVHMRPGTVASLRDTATGKAFAAFQTRDGYSMRLPMTAPIAPQASARCHGNSKRNWRRCVPAASASRSTAPWPASARWRRRCSMSTAGG